MTDPSLDDVERQLDRATDCETETAIEILQAARETIEELDGAPDVDDERRRAIAARIDQRLREVSARDADRSELGAAMNPDDEDAP